MDKTKMQKTIIDILNVFSGVDGGISFINFRCLMEDMEQNAINGDKDAEQVCEMVYRFNRLLKYTKERNNEKSN